MRFAPEYVRSVLAENFEDAKRLFLAPLMAVHRAHLVMLAERAILSPSDAHRLRLALDRVSLDEISRARFDGSAEDLFFHVNALIEDACSPDLAGRLHTARSRNDIDMTMYRMRLREGVLSLSEEAIGLRAVLCGLAGDHRETVVALHTHTQPAQPSTIAHYLLAVIEQLERDARRLGASYEVTNRCPLGACAITGTGFPIDRDLTSRLLGFDGPTGNTYGSIASVDYLLQGAAAAATLLVGLGRFLQDLLLWSTAEFGYLRLGDGFVQGSSIMPQKRNPVALEHARSIASRALGEAMAIQVSVHNTPFGDVVDTEDDLQPLVDLMIHDAGRALRVTSAALATARFDPASLEARAAAGGTTLTELADTLVREHGLAFGQAHAIAARVAAAGDDAVRSLPEVLASASAAVTGEPLVYDAARLAEVLGPRHFVRVRATHGGPAPERTREALLASRARLEEDRAWLVGVRRGLAAAEAQLAQRSGEL
ncbi:MAG TPA: argininosuccinate lyase [Vicinamibacterales bacterium]|nr:argininosuccinate lyase [Vicinamibacterales bacterium]